MIRGEGRTTRIRVVYMRRGHSQRRRVAAVRFVSAVQAAKGTAVAGGQEASIEVIVLMKRSAEGRSRRTCAGRG